MVEAAKAVRHGAALMSADQVAGIQALFEGDAWQHMTTRSPAELLEHIVAVSEDGCEVLDLRAGEDASWARP